MFLSLHLSRIKVYLNNSNLRRLRIGQNCVSKSEERSNKTAILANPAINGHYQDDSRKKHQNNFLATRGSHRS